MSERVFFAEYEDMNEDFMCRYEQNTILGKTHPIHPMLKIEAASWTATCSALLTYYVTAFVECLYCTPFYLYMVNAALTTVSSFPVPPWQLLQSTMFHAKMPFQILLPAVRIWAALTGAAL